MGLKTELVILGAGPAGYEAAIHAGRADRKRPGRRHMS